MTRYLLGIDVGTTNVKAAIYTTEFLKEAEAFSEYPTYFPHTGWAEQNAEHWWAAAVDALKKSVAASSINLKNIQGICVSSQAPAVLPVDCDGLPLRNALIWMDRRSEAQCGYLRKHVTQEKIASITGNRVDPYFALSKLLWFKEKEPGAYGKAYKILQVNGYINFRLTGRFTCDKVHASLMGLYDVNRLSWSEELCTLLDLKPELLPQVFEATDIIGTVSREASLAMGLPEGIPVVAGNVDASSSALEAGVAGTGEAVEMTGTSTVLMLGCDQWHSSINLVSMFHPIKGHSLLIGPISSTGASLKWYRDQLGSDEKRRAAELNMDPYKYMDLQAAGAAPGSGGLVFLPYMAGERAPIWDSRARGVFFGLTHSTTRSQMIRAILEGSSFALYHNMEEAEKSGLAVEKLRAVGGGSESRLWLQIKASVINKPVVTLANSSNGTFGNILLAGCGTNIYGDVREVLEKNVKFKEVFQPDLTLHKHYQKLYRVYRSLYDHIKDDFRQLEEITPGGE